MHLPRLRGPDSEAVSPLATVVRAPNPGPMTLDGTNSYVLRRPGSAGVVVVDPGPSIAEHLEHLAGFGTVELVLLTHHHPDHSEALHEFARLVGAPARAIDAQYCLDADPIVDGERLQVAGIELEVVATPGHTADSVSFHLPGDGDNVGRRRSHVDEQRGGHPPRDECRTGQEVRRGDAPAGRAL